MSSQEDITIQHQYLHPQSPLQGQSQGQAAWYLLQCKPQQNFRAQENLNNQGFSCYLPVVHTERVQQGRRRDVTEPLFPGYLFIHLDCVNDNWGPIRSTRGVTRMVGFNGKPHPVPLSVIEALRQRMTVQPCMADLLPGDRVMIINGAFADIEAIFKAYDGDERVVILLNLMRREQQLVLPVSSIEKREGIYA